MELLLTELEQLHYASPNPYKAGAYKRAISSLKKLPLNEFNNRESFIDLPHIGKSINERIIKFKLHGPSVIKSAPVKVRKSFVTQRVQINAINALIEKRLLQIKSNLILVGSYRRKVAWIADIDALCFHQNKKIVTSYCNKQFEPLVLGDKKASYIICNENNIQLDVNFITRDELPFAMLHHTGSFDHNIKMRRQAKSLNYKLNQYGLWDSKNDLIDCFSEQEIFEQLRMPYVEPFFR